jgi:putative methyltransferase (TIGR04325 family)
MYRDRLETAYPHDYPVMFWLQKLLALGCTRIFDLGGHVGTRYYAFRPYLDYSDAGRWLVCDVPAVAAAGQRMAARNGSAPRLSFCDRFEQAEGMDVLLALASLQYLRETLADRLKNLTSAPTHLILNAVPLHPRYSYFTLQSIGTAFCPYRITAVEEFLAPYADLGYTLVDRWENPDKRCAIPFHPDRSLDRYFGFYFRRAS